MNRKEFGAFALIVCGIGFVPAEPAAEPGLPELTVEQISSTPLPYQAIRLRITARNAGKAAIENSAPLEYACHLTDIKGPSDKQPRFPGNPQRLSLWPLATSAPNFYHMQVAKQTITWKPGETQTLTDAFLGMGIDYHLILFVEPGDHEFKVVSAFAKEATPRSNAKQFRVTVPKPQNDDAAWFHLLTKKPSVRKNWVYALGFHHPPNALAAGALDAYVDLYPKSSYVPYARLLLARHYLDQWREVGGEKRPPFPDDVKAARKHLEAIDLKGFPYAPDVLVELKRVATLEDDAAAVKKLDALLQADFPDAYEWFEEQAKDGISFEKIQENRKAAQAKPDPKKP
jgi:hypothetical protein